MADPNRPATFPPDREAIPCWDLVSDERAPLTAIIMRFTSYEAAHRVLTGAGFTPTSDSVHVPQHHDSRTAVKYAHPEGSTVVLARQLADACLDAASLREDRLALASAG